MTLWRHHRAETQALAAIMHVQHNPDEMRNVEEPKATLTDIQAREWQRILEVYESVIEDRTGFKRRRHHGLD
jgi:hypothetical protein